MRKIAKRLGDTERSWPGYLFGGHIRTSTVVLIVVFVALWWIYDTYRPSQPTETSPTTQVVPPGFVPDPNYTWVPRTRVRAPENMPSTTTPPTTTTTTPSTPTTTTTMPPPFVLPTLPCLLPPPLCPPSTTPTTPGPPGVPNPPTPTPTPGPGVGPVPIPAPPAG